MPASASRASRSDSNAALLVTLLVWTVAVAVDPAAREAFRLPKAALGSLLALASLVALAWARRLPLDRRLLSAPAVRATAPLLAAAVVSALLSPHSRHVARALPGLAIGLAAVAGWSLGFGRERLRALLDLLLWPAALLAAVGILQFHHLYQPFAFVERAAERFEVTGLAGNVGDLGAALVLPALLAQLALHRARSRRQRLVAGGQLLLLVWGVGVSQTLAALAALGAGTVVLWGCLLPRRRFVGATCAALAALSFSLAFLGPLRERTVEKATDLAAGNLNRLLTGRLDGWRTAVWMLRERPLAGVGPGAFAAEFVPAKRALLDRGVPFFPEQQHVVFANAHQELLEVGAELGLLGLAALAWGLGLAVRAGASRAPGEERALAAAGGAALAILALVFFPARIAVTGFPAALFAAWLLSREEGPSPWPAGRRPARIAAAFLAAALLLHGLAVRDRWIASRQLRAVEARSLRALPFASTERGRAVFEANLALLAEAARRDPAEIGIRVAIGSQYLLLGRPGAAAAAYRDALALEPRPEIHLNLARALELGGESEAARRELDLALRLAPHLAAEVGPR